MADTFSGKEAEQHACNITYHTDMVVPVSNALDSDAAAALLGPHYGNSTFRRKRDGGC